MTARVFRKLALSLPESHEEPHFDRASFRVGKKIFATLTAKGDEVMVRVAPPERLFALLGGRRDVFFDYGAWTARNGALGVRLARVPPGLMRELLVDSWRRVAPKRALRVFG